MPVSVGQLVSSLSASGLWPEEQLSALDSLLETYHGHDDARNLCDHLVRQNKLTVFQAEALYDGRQCELVLGNYVLLDKLGEGGMGVVFRAVHRRMERIVALKVLPSPVSRNPDAVGRFHREVRAVSRLSHPNIVAAYDADEAEGRHFLVMEYVDGRDLSQLVEVEGPRPVRQAVDYILQAAQGLEHAHSRGIVHRDVKPANLVLDHSGCVRILDMGLARLELDVDSSAGGLTQPEITRNGVLIGTVDYMPPEQAVDAREADHRADVYALGCTLFYLLTGRTCYTGETFMKRLLAHREQPIPELRAVRNDVPEALDLLFQHMVAKSPEDRPQSMREVIEALGSMPLPEDAAAEGPGDGRAGSSDGGAAGGPMPIAPQPAAPAAQTSSRQSILDTSTGWEPAEAASIPKRAGTGTETPLVPDDPATRPPDTGSEGPFWPSPTPAAARRTNSLGMALVRIAPGEFLMGSTLEEVAQLLQSTTNPGQQAGFRAECPARRVRITGAFAISACPVTQQDYQKIMQGRNPSHFSAAGGCADAVAGQDTRRHPVEHVSWFDAVTFCNRLSEREGLSPCYEGSGRHLRFVGGSGYRLPTEAEWEYACRAGSTSRFCFGDDEAALDEYGWSVGNSGGTTHPVGEKLPNAFGLYDMHGLVWEWCEDWFAEDARGAGDVEDPRGPRSGSLRVIRGGVWSHRPVFCRSAVRGRFTPAFRSGFTGFRVACDVPD